MKWMAHSLDVDSPLGKAIAKMWEMCPDGVMLCPNCKGYGATIYFDKKSGAFKKYSCPCGYESKVYNPMA